LHDTLPGDGDADVDAEQACGPALFDLACVAGNKTLTWDNGRSVAKN